MKIIETGYMIYISEKDQYYYSNNGIYKTERGAQKIVDCIKSRYPGARVVKVSIIEEDANDGK